MATKPVWTTPQPPQLGNLDAYTKVDAIEPAGTYESVRFDGCDVAGKKVTRFTCLKALFSHVDCSRTHWSSVKLTDVALRDCILANARWPDARFVRVEVTDCKLVGIDLENSQFADCVFRGCTLELAAITDAQFRNCLFEDCNLRLATFEGSDLRGTPFVNCVLRETTLLNAKLTHTNFRGSDISKLIVDPGNLNGAIVDPSQAAQLAYELLGMRPE